MLIGLVFYFQ